MSKQISKKVKYDHFKLRGQLEYVLRNAVTGEIVEHRKKKNTVTYMGRGWALARVAQSNVATNVLTAIGLGGTSTAPNVTNNALLGYDTCRTFNGGTTLTTSTSAACTFSAAVSFNSNETWTNSSAIGEFALFNNTTNSSNTIFNRLATASYINFASTNTLAISISITN